MHRTKSLSIKSATVAGIAASFLLGLAGLTLNPTPAKAVVYCQYVEYPVGCVARAGVITSAATQMAASIAWECGGKALLVSAALSKNATASIAARDSAIDSLGNPAFVGLFNDPLELTPG